MMGALLLSLAVPIAPLALGQGSDSTLILTVFPDGSVSAGLVGTSVTTPTSPMGSFDFKAGITTSGSQSTIVVNGSESLPPGYANQYPYNTTNSVSVTGSFIGGVSKGSVSVQAVPGLDSPFSSFKLNYVGTSTSITAEGNTTVQYGTYASGGSTLEINASSIATYISNAESNGLNQSALNKELAQYPGNFTVQSFSITPNYGADSALVSGQFVLNGNISEIPYLYANYITSLAGVNASYTPPPSATLPLQAYNDILTSFQDYSYSVAYASGVIGFSATVHAAANLNIDQAMVPLADYAALNASTAAQAQFINTTKVDVSGFHLDASGSDQPDGTFVSTVSAHGFTIRPAVSMSGGAFTESGLFNFLGYGSTSPANVTIIGGSSPVGSVALSIPSSVPAPTSTTSNSATWTDVSLSALAAVGFTGGSQSTTTTTSGSSSATTSGPGTSSSQSGSTTTSGTTSTPSSSSGGGVPEYPYTVPAVILFTLFVVGSYLLLRKPSLIRRPAPR
jgi:hypothetical protein